MARLAIVLTFVGSDEPGLLGQLAVRLLRRIDPPRLPGFDGQARVVVDTDVDDLVRWLDEGDEPKERRAWTFDSTPAPGHE